MIDEENGQTRKTKGGKRYQKKQKGKKGKIAGIIVAIILILLVILLGVGTGMVAGKISKINFDKLDKGDLDVNEDLYTEVSDNVSKEEFEKIAKEKEVDKIIPILNLDAEIKLDDVNKEMVDSLKELEPFGEANKMPIFAFRNLKIDSIRSLSEGKHLRLSVKDNKNIINAIGFNMGALADTYRIGDRVDIAGNLEINSFNGVDSIQINIKDIMKSI